MEGVFGIVVIFCSLTAVSQGRERCTISDNSRYGRNNLSFQFCRYSCCGTWPDERCCPVATWVIVVSAIGAIIFFSGIVTVICCACNRKQSSQRGQVIPPGGRQPGGPAVIYTTTAGAQPYNRGYQHEPMAYWNQSPAPAPAYTGASQPGQNPAVPPQNPAYPSSRETTSTKTTLM